MSGILQGLIASISSAAAAVTDTYFNLVTLLLNTTSTNGAQNNTFIDDSSSPLTITRNGNTTQGTFTPFSQTGWSNYFPGSSYLTTPSNAAFAMGTGDFTIETFAYYTSFANVDAIGLSNWNGSSWSANNWSFHLDHATQRYKISFWVNNYSSSAQILLSTTTIALNTWYHIAVTRSGNTWRLFVNGALEASATSSVSLDGGISPIIYIAGTGNTTQQYIGNLSNTRIVKGTAVYTSAFTTPTTPLTAISGTSLLTCQSNRFIDNSASPLTLTINGTPSVQAFSPFLPTAAYDTAVVGGSGYFDGTGDYLNTASSSAFNLSSVSWTIECFVYLGDYTGDARIWSIVSSTTDMYAVYLRSGTLYIGPLGISEVSMGSITKGQWYHIAFVNVAGTITCYKNGVSAGTASYTFPNTDCSFYVAASPANYALSTTQGYIASLRVLKGTALYTTTFTPPTAPLTAITNTQLLLNFTNGGIYDSAAKNDLETVGNAQVSTTQAKWGTTAIYLDGTGDYLVGRTNPALGMGTGAFTWEAWVYPTATRSGAAHIYDTLPPGGTGSRANSMIWGINSTNKLFVFTNGSTAITSSASISLNTWTHVAFVREGTGTNQTKFYINGTNDGTGTVSTNDNLGGQVVGASADDLTNNNAMFQGYMDDLRITKYARYTSNFTPPAAAFPIQ